MLAPVAPAAQAAFRGHARRLTAVIGLLALLALGPLGCASTPTPQPVSVALPSPTLAPPTATAVPPTPTVPPPTATSTVSPTPVPPTLTPTPSVTPTPTRPAGVRRTPSPDQPLLVLVSGDSFAQPVGVDMDRYSASHQLVRPQLDFKISSGLARPDFFDWPAHMRDLMSSNPAPEAVIFFAGANDTQNMWVGETLATGTTPEWKAEYARRAGTLMDAVGEGKARLYWIGMPIMRDPWRNDYSVAMNEAIKTAAATRPWVSIVDIWDLFSDQDGRFALELPDYQGKVVRVRQDDGVHLTLPGNEWVSFEVYKRMARDFGFAVP